VHLTTGAAGPCLVEAVGMALTAVRHSGAVPSNFTEHPLYNPVPVPVPKIHPREISVFRNHGLGGHGFNAVRAFGRSTARPNRQRRLMITAAPAKDDRSRRIESVDAAAGDKSAVEA
jgi:hypothetical protein